MCGLGRTRQVVQDDVPSANVHLVACLFQAYFAADAQEYPVAFRIARPDEVFGSPRHDFGVCGPGEYLDFEIADLGD
jgi:hypothetical protein